jgi:hypothetical protein
MSYAETMRRLGMCSSGGGATVLKKWLKVWCISTEHFDADQARRQNLRQRSMPLEGVLVERSAYSRKNLKHRLYQEGLKARECEFCGQGEDWHGRRMSLILDHVNGVATDNRLANLRIVCPNCAATLETHCGRKNRRPAELRACALCGSSFLVRNPKHRYCSRECGSRAPKPRLNGPRPHRRRVERPPYDQLRREIAESGYSAVGRRYGVSDNAIRKWVRSYEREDEAA